MHVLSSLLAAVYTTLNMATPFLPLQHPFLTGQFVLQEWDTLGMAQLWAPTAVPLALTTHTLA